MQRGKDILILLVFISLLPIHHYSLSSIVEFRITDQEPEYWPTTGWRTSTPEEQGMSSVKLQEMYEYLNSTDYLKIVQASMRSILIIRNGYLVHENYLSSFYNENISINIYSCTKSVTSALIGKAIEEGHIGSVKDPVVDYFPNRTIDNLSTWKKAMTIEDLLTMRSGLAWDESDYSNPNNDYSQMYSAPDTVQYVLDKPMSSTPGTLWEYNTGCSHLLSAIIDNTTEIGTRNFAQSRLFEPLGIELPPWTLDRQDIPYGGSNLRLTPRQMAKFGFLYLNNGSWDNQQQIPSEWVSNSTQAVGYQSTSWSYGYQWWSSPNRNSYSARGYGGQYIVVIPNLDMVIVFTANSNLVDYPKLIDGFIIPAIGYVPTTTSIIPLTNTGTAHLLTTTNEILSSETTTNNTSFPSFVTVLLFLGTLVVVIRRRKMK